MQSQIIPLKNRGVLKLCGPDAIPFLQSLVTQDVHIVSPNNTVYTALLTAEGRYLSDFFIISQSNECLLLDMEREHISTVKMMLERYRLRHQLDIKDVSLDWYVFSILGKRSAIDTFHPSPLKGQTRHTSKSITFTDPRFEDLGLRTLTQEDGLPFDAIPRDNDEEYLTLRYDLGVAEGSELIQSRSIILEYGLNDLNAISFHKGCYLGQELMARTLYKGAINKHIFPCTFEGGTLDKDTRLFYKGQEVGRTRAIFKDKALALINVNCVKEMNLKEAHLISKENIIVRPHIASWMKL
jgi:folate-binding protein YgfZ